MKVRLNLLSVWANKQVPVSSLLSPDSNAKDSLSFP